jgi:uncharacterized protein (TIGR03067 family)
VHDGKEIKLVNATQAVITGDKSVVKAGNQVTATGTFKLDPTKRPKALDFTSNQGPGKGKTFKGIYELRGDTLKFCLAGSPDQDRPTKFRSKPGSSQLVFVYKRASR